MAFTSKRIENLMERRLAATDREVRALIIRRGKEVLQRWKPASEFLFAMGTEFFILTDGSHIDSFSFDARRSGRGVPPQYVQDFYNLAAAYGEQFGYNPFRIKKDGTVITDW